ncbi:MAG TPA: hypothetical protein VFF69_05245 [Phycisphaerales bacterium]|nr:hypothetical protein [Phycisphaerales bacterium]
MAKKPAPEPTPERPDKPDRGDRLKIDGDWEDAAERLLKTPAKSTPPREVKPRKKPKLDEK